MRPQLTRNRCNSVVIKKGCAEQTFANWKPNIVAYKYLKSIGKLTKTRKDEIKAYLKLGYQEILKLSRIYDDGSFSIYEGIKKEDRTWITAFFVKLLTQAKNIVLIDVAKITKALKYLKTVQNENGSFNGSSLNKYSNRIKSNVATSTSLTAFVLSAFIEYNENNDFTDVIDNGVKFLKGQIIDISSMDNYELALSAYALSLNEPKGNETRNLLKKMALKAQQFDGTMEQK